MEPVKVTSAKHHEYFKLEEPKEQPKGNPDYPRYETHRNGHRVLLQNADDHQAFYDDHSAAGALKFEHEGVAHEVSEPIRETVEAAKED